MRVTLLILGLFFAAFLAPPAHAGEGPPRFEDRPSVGQPVRFTDAAGHVFGPDRLVVLGRDGARAARLPSATRHARSEEHLDLSGLPLLGPLFRDRLAPGDAEARGVRVGPLTRIGDTLVLDARGGPAAFTPGAVVLTANLPHHGAVSYRLGRLPFAPAAPPQGRGRPAGTAWLVGDTLVLAGPGREPAIKNLERSIGDFLR